MYGAVRERARTSTQITGLSAAVLTTALVGYALANGFAVDIARMIDTTITFTPMAEDVLPEKSVEPTALDSTATSLDIPSPLPPDIDFVWKPETISGPTGEIEPRPPITPVKDIAIPKPVHIRPVLINDETPPYPASELRKGNEGLTSLEVCVSASGRVTSASIAASSGHPVLDNAALKWVRSSRFKPGKLDGAAEAICGHPVIYEWNLADARK